MSLNSRSATLLLALTYQRICCFDHTMFRFRCYLYAGCVNSNTVIYALLFLYNLRVALLIIMQLLKEMQRFFLYCEEGCKEKTLYNLRMILSLCCP